MDVPHLVFTSHLMKQAVETARRMAVTSGPVLIEGESGTGKELVARLIHSVSPRRRRAFVPVNCGAIPEPLFESELFGYRAGAFTGAWRDKPGIFELADSGTLFLDEIGDLSLAMQAKCLRVLQENEMRRVGDTRSCRLDLRVIAATNKNLDAEMRRRAFREDLFFRISVLRLHLPPLRDRKEDVEILARHFIGRYARQLGCKTPQLSHELLDLFRSYRWPGNVRELENEIHRMVALSTDGQPLDLSLVSSRIADQVEGKQASLGSEKLSTRLASYERQIIKEALERYGWNKTQAARHLGLTRQGLHRKLHRLRIRRAE